LAQNGKQGMWITSLNSHFPPQEPQHQMLRRKKAEPKTPHFLSLNQDIVAWSQEEKCGLKYVEVSYQFAGTSTYYDTVPGYE